MIHFLCKLNLVNSTRNVCVKYPATLKASFYILFLSKLLNEVEEQNKVSKCQSIHSSYANLNDYVDFIYFKTRITSNLY